MKPLPDEINILPANVSAMLMDVVPLIANRIRTEMRSLRLPGLSVPQFCVLTFLFRHQDASLSQVSEHIGLKLPSTSKLIDALTERKLVIRNENGEDRRYLSLKLSSNGIKELTRIRKMTQNRFSAILTTLTKEQQAQVIETLETLRPLFGHASATPPKP
jgi:DNA-binding MarR family transcriptional regulator